MDMSIEEEVLIAEVSRPDDRTDWRWWVGESFRDQFARSQAIRSDMFALKPKALSIYNEILSQPVDVNNAPLLGAQVKVASTVLGTNLIEMPKIEHRTVDASLTSRTTHTHRVEIPAVTKAELLEATKEAAEAEVMLLRQRHVQESEMVPSSSHPSVMELGVLEAEVIK